MKHPAILVVDDEPNARFGVSYTLQEWGGEGAVIDSAENGAQALERLRSQPYDLLLTDIRMPVMDGIQLLEAVRADHNPIRCIMLTGFAEFEYAQSALRLGVVDYLLKPVQQDQLVEAVEKALSALHTEQTAANSRARQDSSSEEPLQLQPHPDEPDNPSVAKAIRYIHEHIHEALPIKEVAAHVHLNSSYFSVLFKEELGINFIDYVTEFRMKKAKELLVHSTLSLDDISEQIGYQTTSYFIKIFKKHEQMTPKTYRDCSKQRNRQLQR